MEIRFVSLAALRGHEEYPSFEGIGSKVFEPVGNSEVFKFGTVGNPRSILDEIVRDGARKMLQNALEDEVSVFLKSHASKVDDNGRRLVVRNGDLPCRELMTGAGNLDIEQPRVRDRSRSCCLDK